MKNSFGNQIQLTIFGESHGVAVGAILDGLPANCEVDSEFLALCMDKRRARGDGLSTARTEADEIKILSGVVAGKTTGTPITFMVENKNTRSQDYAKTADLLRPGHADYTAYLKYKGGQDARGGGHFSGRITAGLCAAGGLCLSLLQKRGIQIETHIAKVAGISDESFNMHSIEVLKGQIENLQKITPPNFALNKPTLQEEMQEKIRLASHAGDSVGGVLETAIVGMPGGVGEPFFDSLESEISHICFSIPAVKAISFGLGFDFADLNASEANDAFEIQNGEIVTTTNNNAGINGGISNGMPIVFKTAIKPTPSIFKAQRTVDYLSKQNATLELKGRHDPCIVHRAAIVQTCATAIAVADLLSVRYGEKWWLCEDENGGSAKCNMD